MSKLNQEIYSIATQSAIAVVSAQTNQLKEEFDKQIKQQEERIAKLIETLVKRK